MRTDDEVERKFYEIEAYKISRSLEEPGRQYDSALFTSLALNKNKNEIFAKQGQVVEKPQDVQRPLCFGIHRSSGTISLL